MAAVITSVRIESLRGIRAGTVEGLGPLSVLVGPNNAGKSTVLDALLIGAAPETRKAIAFVVRRRAVEQGARWLFWRSGERATVSVTTRAGIERRCTLARLDALVEYTVVIPGGSVDGAIRLGGSVSGAVRFGEDNTMVEGRVGGAEGDLAALEGVPEARLVEAHRGVYQEPLHRIYNRATEEGRIEGVNALLGELLPEGFRRVEIGAPADKPVVYVTYKDHALPAALQGDGVQSLLRLGLELASAPGGVVLVEEPEAAQHPRALYESARAIVAAVRRGVQVVFSTHSLELLDMLRTHLDEDLGKLTVHHLACPNGELSVVRYSGSEVKLARDAIGEDLR
jgi:hypothetical protein